MGKGMFRTALFISLFVLIMVKSACGQVLAQTQVKGFAHMREITSEELSGMTSGIVVVLAPIDQSGQDDLTGERIIIEQIYQGQVSLGFVVYKASFTSPGPTSKLLFVPLYKLNGKPVHDFVFYQDGREWFTYQDDGGQINLQAHFWDSLKVRLLINQSIVPELNLYHGQLRPVKKGWRMNTIIPSQNKISVVLPKGGTTEISFYI